MREVRSYCRICSGNCGVQLTIDDDDRVLSIRGDKSHAMTSGYACIKGLQANDIMRGPQRLLHPLKRQPDGTFAPIGIAQAMDEIAARLGAIVDADGPRALAVYRGTLNNRSTIGYPMPGAFLRAFGSPNLFSTATIDQSAKGVAAGRMGFWSAGKHDFEDADVWMCVGYNPLVSVQGGFGFPTLNPLKRLRAAKQRGMKLIVIDPRRTETAAFADIHLQPLPGQDVALAAGLMRIILTEDLHDRAFCDAWVADLDALRVAVEPFTPEMVAARAGVDADRLRDAARQFAGAERGCVQTGTGPDMARHSNLAEHLYEAINVVCGRFLRAGERVANPGVLSPRAPRRAEVVGARRPWEKGPKSRIRDLGQIYGEMMSGALADEMLQPGEGRIRSLFVIGGNPASVLPDQRKAVRAMEQLDLLVVIDPVMSETAALADYILPPKILYERADATFFNETATYPVPFAQYTPEVVKPPEGSELIDDWYPFWAVAQRLGRQISFDGVDLDMAVIPTTDDLIALRGRRAQVPFSDVAAAEGGATFAIEQRVEPARPDATARFRLAAPDILAEFAAAEASAAEEGGDYPYLLTVRRVREVMNTCYRELPAIRKRMPWNPLQLHPDDVAGLGLEEGALVRIASMHGSVAARIECDDSLRPGVVTMNHGWGALPGDRRGYQDVGSSTNLLTSADKDIETINSMARMTGIPVRIDRDVDLQPARY